VLDSTLRVLAICGSLRKASYNRAVLNALVDLAPADFELTTFFLDAIPMFNEDDLDVNGYPAVVQSFRSDIAAADGIVIATPEYYHSVPGVLKNAIDWTGGKPSVFNDKPVAIVSAAPGLHGGLRAQYDLREVLQALGGLVLARPEVSVGSAERKFDPSGKLIDEGTRLALEAWLSAFSNWIARLQMQQRLEELR
jgi:chromate reductase